MSIYEKKSDMTDVYSHCSRFTRRSDLNVFNMMDYQSCENCRHMDEERGCIVKADLRTDALSRFE